jgi:hypothetical protein
MYNVTLRHVRVTVAAMKRKRCVLYVLLRYLSLSTKRIHVLRGNKGPTRCNTLVFYCKTYCLLNMFRAPLCPSRGALELYRWLLSVVLGSLVHRSLVWCGAVGYVSGLRDTARLQAAAICITLELLMMDIMVPETC